MEKCWTEGQLLLNFTSNLESAPTSELQLLHLGIRTNMTRLPFHRLAVDVKTVGCEEAGDGMVAGVEGDQVPRWPQRI